MAELAHINRFSTAGELTATIAHEINQPLGAIRTKAETLELMLKSFPWDVDEIREAAQLSSLVRAEQAAFKRPDESGHAAILH